MQDTITKSASAAAELKDARLFREACYVDGQWIQASSGQTINVDNPATKEIIGKVPKLGGAETTPRHRSRERRLSRMEQENRERTRRRSPPLVRSDDGQPGRPRAADDPRARQAARRIARRSRLRRRVSRMVWRRSQARLRRHHSSASSRQKNRRHQAAHRRRRLHHSLEFSAGHDHAQSGTGDWLRLHRGAEARLANSVFRARSCRARRTRWRSQRRASILSRVRPPKSAPNSPPIPSFESSRSPAPRKSAKS